MTNVDIPVADSLRVIDHEVFGRHVLIWALSKQELRPQTIGDLKEKFPDAAAALYIPDHVTDADELVLTQGEISKHHINLPPLQKLLPMLDYLEKPATEFVDAADLGYDPNNPPEIASNPGEDEYEFPQFYSDHIDDNLQDIVKLFLNRVGDYSYNGCR